MCRICFVPVSNGTALSFNQWIEFLEELDKLGGHGWGVSGFGKEGTPWCLKNVDYTTSDVAKIILDNTDNTGLLVHTRMPTVGPSVDELCQPFVFNNMAIAHNGHWSDWDDYAELAKIIIAKTNGKVPKYLSDSYVGAAMLSMYPDFIKALSGIWLVQDNMLDCYLHGNFEVTNINGSHIYASHFPSWIESSIINGEGENINDFTTKLCHVGEKPKSFYPALTPTSKQLTTSKTKVQVGDIVRIKYNKHDYRDNKDPIENSIGRVTRVEQVPTIRSVYCYVNFDLPLTLTDGTRVVKTETISSYSSVFHQDEVEVLFSDTDIQNIQGEK